jgi:hypothetical protein
MVDMWATDDVLTLERFESFLYTTPFAIEKYGALMKRQNVVTIYGNTISAGIDIEIYYALFAILLLLFIISSINERYQHLNKRNSTWHLLLSLFPMNGPMWPNETGATRKFLMATIGFGILIITSLYQASLAEQLMIPYPPPMVTLKYIEDALSSHNAKLVITFENSPVLSYLSNVSKIISDAVNTNPPVYASTATEVFDYVDNHNGIYIEGESLVLQYLSLIKPELCKNYVFLTFDEWTRIYSAFIMRKERVDVLESMNVIVAERLSYVNDYMDSYELKKECRKHIFPVYTPDPTYSALILADFSGPVAFLVLFLTFSLLVLLLEIVFSKCKKKSLSTESDFRPYLIHLLIDNTFAPNTRDTISFHYSKILEAIQDDCNGYLNENINLIY